METSLSRKRQKYAIQFYHKSRAELSPSEAASELSHALRPTWAQRLVIHPLHPLHIPCIGESAQGMNDRARAPSIQGRKEGRR
jgi:hypothetical protein